MSHLGLVCGEKMLSSGACALHTTVKHMLQVGGCLEAANACGDTRTASHVFRKLHDLCVQYEHQWAPATRSV
jgi:hypothetical protein